KPGREMTSRKEERTVSVFAWFSFTFLTYEFCLTPACHRGRGAPERLQRIKMSQLHFCLSVACYRHARRPAAHCSRRRIIFLFGVMARTDIESRHRRCAVREGAIIPGARCYHRLGARLAQRAGKRECKEHCYPKRL